MRVFFVFIYSFITFLTLTCSSQTKSNLRLIVSPIGHIVVEDGPPVLVRKVDDFLNLTCRLIDEKHEPLQNYNITWNWQYSSSNYNRVMMVSLSHNAANLVFKALKETDSGEYTCKCSELDLYQNVWLKVKAFKRTCSDKMFVCTNGNCIAKHYMCDGKVDCKGGVDEAREHCGANPCEGKIPCDDGRCIPESWCCDVATDPNCTTKYMPKCCLRHISGNIIDDEPGQWDKRFGDIGFLQTTIYTVIGCAMAFMFIVTILVIAICRIHLKRTVISRCPLNHQHHHLRPGSPLRPGTLPLYDIDMFLDHRHQESHTGGLLVTYNINNGVQFVGRPIDPPPYCEVVDTPPREGPPPPYVSRENITQEATPPENEENESASQEEDKNTENEPPATEQNEIRFTRVPNEVVSNLKGLTSKSRATLSSELNNVTHSMGDVSKFNQDHSSTSYDFCSSVPSVSGLSKIRNKNIKRNVLTDFSDSESDSSCMENDALLNANLRKSCDNNSDDFKSKSVVLNNETSSNSFINNIAAVSKSLIGSLSKKAITETELKPVKHRTIPNTNRKPFKPLLTQKSFDSSDRTRKELVLSDGGNNNFDKVVPSVTHSLGDLSPVSNDLNYGDFSERRDFLTLPLRESFIGVRNEEI